MPKRRWDKVVPIGQLWAAVERLHRNDPKPKRTGKPFYSPVGGTITMRIGVEDAWAIREAARKRKQTIAQVIQSRDW